MKKIVVCLAVLTLVPRTWAMEKMEKNEKNETKGENAASYKLSCKGEPLDEDIFAYPALRSISKFKKLEEKGIDDLIVKTTKYASKAHEPFEADVERIPYELAVSMKRNMMRSFKYGIFMALLSKSKKETVSIFPSPEMKELFLTPTLALLEKFDTWDDAAVIEKAEKCARKLHAPFQPIMNAARQSQPSESTLKNMRRSLKYGVLIALLCTLKAKLFHKHLKGCYGPVGANALRRASRLLLLEPLARATQSAPENVP
ncbi:MAG: hypothetical protein M1549_00820 [Candidatus Dependentiae bacterium]|nr:hypothetical protein [Candidatus Dependentiae bacterium]